LLGSNGTKTAIFEIRLEGEFDFSECRRVTEAFLVSTSAPLVILNLAGTESIDSKILECIVALQLATAQRNARFMVTGACGSVRRLLEINKLGGYFDVQANLDELSLRGTIRRLTLVSATGSTV
jgi:anti-sigma B factor antagonist